MSCRVLGRRVEDAVLAELLAEGRKRGVTRLRGTYRPTPRNAMVQHHFPELGFSLLDEEPDGTTRWSLALDDGARRSSFVGEVARI